MSVWNRFVSQSHLQAHVSTTKMCLLTMNSHIFHPLCLSPPLYHRSQSLLHTRQMLHSLSEKKPLQTNSCLIPPKSPQLGTTLVILIPNFLRQIWNLVLGSLLLELLWQSSMQSWDNGPEVWFPVNHSLCRPDSHSSLVHIRTLTRLVLIACVWQGDRPR